ncbi:MAG: hypothetical protein QOE75_2285 [Solirubrobacterales bacterium]|nr:hypothetical protein [Solirubrobacterales bacterium]
MDWGSFLLLALMAMFTPTLLAAVTIMMLLPNPKRLMLGYLLGAYMTSITLGLVIVFSLHDSGVVNTSQRTLGPGEDIILGLLLLVISYVLHGDRDARLRERRRRRKEAKEAKEAAGEVKPSWPDRMLGKGDPRITFAVGAALTLPGVSYLAALDKIADYDPGAAPTVLLVVGFCLVQLTLIEVPLLGYAFAPEQTKDRVTRFRTWLSRNGRRVAIRFAAGLGGLLILRGILEFIFR